MFAEFLFVTVRFHYWRGSDGHPINHTDLVFFINYAAINCEYVFIYICEPWLITINNIRITWWIFATVIWSKKRKQKKNMSLRVLRKMSLRGEGSKLNISIHVNLYVCVYDAHFFSLCIKYAWNFLKWNLARKVEWPKSFEFEWFFTSIEWIMLFLIRFKHVFRRISKQARSNERTYLIKVVGP